MEIFAVESGQRSMRSPPMMRSAIAACEANARRYGMARFRYMISAGMKTSSAVITEWVGPRWKLEPMSMSRSGSIDKTSSSGMFGDT